MGFCPFPLSSSPLSALPVIVMEISSSLLYSKKREIPRDCNREGGEGDFFGLEIPKRGKKVRKINESSEVVARKIHFCCPHRKLESQRIFGIPLRSFYEGIF